MRGYLVDDVILFATDPDDLKCSKVPGVYATVDFGPGADPNSMFAMQRATEPKGPLVNSEYYPAWFDNWGVKHATGDTAAVANGLDKILSLVDQNLKIELFLTKIFL